MAEALSTGRVDAVSTWNPYLRQLQKKMGSKGVIYFGETLYTETFCVAATQEYVNKNPETIKKVLRALIKAETFVWDVFTFNVALDQALLVNFEDQTRWVIKNRLATRTDMPNYLDFIYDNGLRSVKPGTVRIVK